MPDRTAIETTDAETRCAAPAGLQGRVDAAVAKADRGRRAPQRAQPLRLSLREQLVEATDERAASNPPSLLQGVRAALRHRGYRARVRRGQHTGERRALALLDACASWCWGSTINGQQLPNYHAGGRGRVGSGGGGGSEGDPGGSGGALGIMTEVKRKQALSFVLARPLPCGTCCCDVLRHHPTIPAFINSTTMMAGDLWTPRPLA